MSPHRRARFGWAVGAGPKGGRGLRDYPAGVTSGEPGRPRRVRWARSGSNWRCRSTDTSLGPTRVKSTRSASAAWSCTSGSSRSMCGAGSRAKRVARSTRARRWWRRRRRTSARPVLGRNMFGAGPAPGPRTAVERLVGRGPSLPHAGLVLTHHPREPLEMEGGTTFFVTDGIESALEQAKQAADGRTCCSAGRQRRPAVPGRRAGR
jgi:hypothetical protein